MLYLMRQRPTLRGSSLRGEPGLEENTGKSLLVGILIAWATLGGLVALAASVDKQNPRQW